MWPRTNRVLPWLAVGFLIMLWLVPFDSTTAPFRAGVDSKLDRVALVLMVGIWITLAFGGGRYGPRFRRSPLNVAILVFVVVVMASVVTQLPVLTNLNLVQLSIKQLALLLSYFTLFYFVVTVVRREEVESFLKFMVILACLTAIGTIVEYRFHTNYFYSWTTSLLKGFHVGNPYHGENAYGRAPVVGPTESALADATILSIALSFALVFLFRARERRERLLWYAAVGLLLAGTLSTQRKSAVLIPLGTLIALTIYSPKQMIRFAPALLVLLLSTYLVAPHAISGLRYQFLTASTSDSTTHRTSAYPGVVPFILSHPFLGTGYGSYAPSKYGILDDQYLGLLIQTGFLGVASFFGLLGTGAVLAHKAVRSGNSTLANQGIALIGAIAGFAIACATFDVLAFPQAPYLLMFVLALTVVAADGVKRRDEPAPVAVPAEAAVAIAQAGAGSQRAPARRKRDRPVPGVRPRPVPAPTLRPRPAPSFAASAGAGSLHAHPKTPLTAPRARNQRRPEIRVRVPHPRIRLPHLRIRVAYPRIRAWVRAVGALPVRALRAATTRARLPVVARSHRPRLERVRQRLALLAISASVLSGGLGFVVAQAEGIAPSAAQHQPQTSTRPVAVNVSYANALNAAMSKLNDARSRTGLSLTHARNSRAQAVAASALATAHHNAAATLLRLDAGTSRRANAALASALRSIGDAYAAMARAAGHGDTRAYNEARASLKDGASALDAAFAQLRVLGYTVGS